MPLGWRPRGRVFGWIPLEGGGRACTRGRGIRDSRTPPGAAHATGGHSPRQDKTGGRGRGSDRAPLCALDPVPGPAARGAWACSGPCLRGGLGADPRRWCGGRAPVGLQPGDDLRCPSPAPTAQGSCRPPGRGGGRDVGCVAGAGFRGSRSRIGRPAAGGGGGMGGNGGEMGGNGGVMGGEMGGNGGKWGEMGGMWGGGGWGSVRNCQNYILGNAHKMCEVMVKVQEKGTENMRIAFHNVPIPPLFPQPRPLSFGLL